MGLQLKMGLVVDWENKSTTGSWKSRERGVGYGSRDVFDGCVLGMTGSPSISLE